MKEINFVELGIDDFEKLQDYMNRLCKYETEVIKNSFLAPDWVFTEEGKEGIKQLLKDKNTFVCLMKDGENEVGYFIGKINEPKFYETPGKTCELDNFYVNKEFRGKGYGKILMQKFLDWGESNGVSKIWISSVTSSNENAKGFYKKMGYVPYTESFYINKKN